MAIQAKPKAVPEALVSNEPVPAPTRIRPALREGVAERFADSDSLVDLGGLPLIGPLLTRALRKRYFHLLIILPSLILMAGVIISGIVGVAEPTQNVGATLTWFIWFALIFPLTLLVGRIWCVTCPFGGVGEWIQRKTIWARKQKALGLGWKMPSSVAKYGLAISAIAFITMTWIEEFFNIAGPGAPILTSIMVLGIISFSVVTFVLFERRTFCRYLCPLSSLIGTAGSCGMVAGFRPKDRETCLNCPTKDCVRGGKEGYGCPWYTYPATADTNTYCGLCSECYKACPYDNLSVYGQKPLTSVVAPKKRTGMAWAVALLFGLVLFQQWNALPAYGTFDDWLNNLMRFPHYPNPVDYLLTIAIVAAIFAGIAYLLSRALSLKTKIARPFSNWFAPLMYGFIPLMGADFLARVMPKFLNNAALAAASVVGLFNAKVGWADFHILPNNWLVRLQYLIVGLGTVATVYAISRIARKDMKDLTEHSTLVRVLPSVIAVVIGAGMITLYVFMNGAE
jgi:NosR/NirI family nitrous oxide reductase transcriptional regulator